MKSGLEGRNNQATQVLLPLPKIVSMKSGLEGRNNPDSSLVFDMRESVSMKSGLEGRNNLPTLPSIPMPARCLNEVRPRRPEQWLASEGRLD